MRRLDATRILPDPTIAPGISVSRASRPWPKSKHTPFYNFVERISFAEHGKLVAELSDFHLMLSRALRARFFNSKYAKNGTF